MGWLYFLCILKKVQIYHPIQCFFYRWHALSLTHKERTTRINFFNSCADHLFYLFHQMCDLKYFFDYSFPDICSIVIRMTRGNWFFFFLFFVLRKSSFMQTDLQTLLTTTVPFLLFLLYVLCFGYLFTSLLCGGNLHSSSVENTRSVKAKLKCVSGWHLKYQIM